MRDGWVNNVITVQALPQDRHISQPTHPFSPSLSNLFSVRYFTPSLATCMGALSRSSPFSHLLSIPFSLSLLSLSLFFFLFHSLACKIHFSSNSLASSLLLSLSLSLSLSRSLLLTHVRVCGLSRYTAIVSIDACAARLYARANLPCADRRLSINGLVVQRNISPYPERACWKNDNSLFDGIRPAFLSLFPCTAGELCFQYSRFLSPSLFFFPFPSFY